MQKGSGYKTYHESMTSNNTGTTPWESLLVVLPSILALHIFASLQSRHWIPEATAGHKVAAFFAEFICIIMPSIVSLTVWADMSIYLFVGMGILGPVLAIKRHSSECKQRRLVSVYSGIFEKKTFKLVGAYKLEPKPRSYITNFRAITNMLTVLCIFAVDFHIFPRRFAKTETFGFGVMDLGVGLFVVANALVAPETRSERSSTISKTVYQSLPLVILGGSRILMTKQVDYQKHVTEYGTHWNFFFTLAVTKVLSNVIVKFVNRGTFGYILMFLGLTITHEISLQIGLQEWVLSNAPRDNLISANREGIISNIGYVALYFGGIALARILRAFDSFSILGNISMMKMLIVLSALFWILTVACDFTIGVSRRLANMGYIFWLLAFSCTVILFLLLIEFGVVMIKVIGLKKPDESVVFVPKILEAINKNGLLFFLLGNLLTGMFNIRVHTFTLNPVTSFVVLSIYMLLNCAAVVILKALDITVKF